MRSHTRFFRAWYAQIHTLCCAFIHAPVTQIGYARDARTSIHKHTSRDRRAASPDIDIWILECEVRAACRRLASASIFRSARTSAAPVPHRRGRMLAARAASGSAGAEENSLERSRGARSRPQRPSRATRNRPRAGQPLCTPVRPIAAAIALRANAASRAQPQTRQRRGSPRSWALAKPRRGRTRRGLPMAITPKSVACWSKGLLPGNALRRMPPPGTACWLLPAYRVRRAFALA